MEIVRPTRGPGQGEVDLLSFILDPYLSVIVGAIFFILSDFFQWKPKVTIAVTGVAAVLATLYSVVLYLDWLPSDILILDNLFPLLRVLPQKGSEIMLHSNVTGATKDTFPVALAILFYLLYPLWVYLGFNITKNLKAPREPTPTHRFGTANYRLGGMGLFLLGELLTLYGLAMPTEYGGQTGFIVANVAIWLVIVGVYLMTIPKSERDPWWKPPGATGG